MYDEADHHTHQKGLSADNSVCKPRTAPNVKTMAKKKLQLVVSHLILHRTAFSSPYHRYSDTILTNYMKTLTVLLYNFHKSQNNNSPC